MNSPNEPAPIRWIWIPAVLTLLITLVRLWGELSFDNTTLFGTEPGGVSAPQTEANPNPPPSLFGIFWLMPLCGIYFGYRLCRAGRGPANRGAALVWPIVGFAIMMGFFGTMIANLGTAQENPSFFYWMLGASAASCLAAVVARLGWPALFQLMLAYGLSARIPIVVLTFILVFVDAGTHYEKLAPMAPTDISPFMRAVWLSLPQLFMWIPMTICAGGLFGALTALFVRGQS